MANAFEFAGRLAQVRDVQELAKLQMDFIQAQMQAMTEQAKDLSETATKAVMDNFENTDNGWSVVLSAKTRRHLNSTYRGGRSTRSSDHDYNSGPIHSEDFH